MDWLWIYGPLVAAAVVGRAPEWAKVVLFVAFPAAFFLSYVNSVPSLVLAVGVLIAVDAVYLNMHDSDRSDMCPCFTRRGGINARLLATSRALDRLVENPHKYTISLCAHMCGSVLGWFIGRPYVRMPLDLYCLYHVDEFRDVEGVPYCVHTLLGGFLPKHPECRHLQRAD